MKVGKIFNRETNSGLGISGEVHIRIYSLSESSKVARARGVEIDSSSSTVCALAGLNGSPKLSGTAIVDAGDTLVRSESLDEDNVVPSTGESINGSLGARGRFFWTVVAIEERLDGARLLDKRGCDVARACTGDEVGNVASVLEVGDDFAEVTSSNARTC